MLLISSAPTLAEFVLVMANVTLLFCIIILAGLPTFFNAQEKQCDHLITVNTGPTRGPTYKLSIILESVGGDSIRTNNLVKNWGAMGKGHTYFLPDSSDIFKYRGRCMQYSFCNIGIRGKKGELKPHWYINNITVASTGDGADRLKEFIRFGEEFAYAYPRIDSGECP